MKKLQISIKAGQTLFDEDEPGHCMYVVSQGAIQISRASSNGRVVLANLGPGDFFGEMAIVAKTRRTARAEALEDSVVMSVADSELEELMNHRPDVAADMIRRLVQRLHDTSDRLIDEREKLGLVLATDKIIKGGTGTDEELPA